jgi:uncharacterized protein (DUF2236 family)
MTSPFERHREAARARVRAAGLARPGPDSITWTINREVLIVASWGRAILLQLAHPAIAAALDDHSSFRGSLLSGVRRMQSTIGAMLAITFGDDEQMIAAAARINTIHDRVRGAGYDAHDRELQRWVHATLLDSTLRTFESLVRRLTVEERDRYCLEAAVMEPLMGMPAGWLPRDAASLDGYMRAALDAGTLHVTPASRALARAVLYPPRWYVAWPAFRPTQLLTIGSLPPAVREAYGFAWSAADARALARWTRLLRAVRRLAPPLAREWPMSRRRDRPAAAAVVESRREADVLAPRRAGAPGRARGDRRLAFGAVRRR